MERTTHSRHRRKPGQAIRFTGPAIVRVTEHRHGVVVLDVWAPLSTRILREETVGETVDSEPPKA